MRAMASITGFLAMVSLGMLICGLIVGERDVWVWGLILLVANCVIGPICQTIADCKDGLYTPEKLDTKKTNVSGKAKKKTEGTEKMGKSFYSDEEVQRMIDGMRKMAAKMDAEEAEKERRASPEFQADLHARFLEHYSRIQKEEKHIRWVKNINQDAAGALLLDVCSAMTYAPRYNDVYGLEGIVALPISNLPMLVYKFSSARTGWIHYSLIALVQMDDTHFRLFSVESSDRCMFLCEFAEYRHINYGEVRFVDTFKRIQQILAESKEKDV